MTRAFGRVSIAFSLSVLLGAAGLAGTLHAEPAGTGSSADIPVVGTYRDGAHIVRVFARAPDPRAGVPAHARAVTLDYGDGRAAPAWIDETAVVRVAPGADLPAMFARAGVRHVRPLMPSAGLHVVAALSGEDGLALATRLHTQRPAAVSSAMPNVYLEHRLAFEPAADPVEPNDPMRGDQWYLDDMSMADAWRYGVGAEDVSVVVVDTGCDLDHPDLAAKLDPGTDVHDQDDDPSYEPGASGAAHGTECAGIVAADTDNGVGISGTCPACRMRCVRLLGESMVNAIAADVAAFEFAFAQNADVVSNSWGFVNAIPVPEPLEVAINNVHDNGRDGRGALVFFASGNDNRRIADDELLAVRGVFGVGAVTHLRRKTNFTNFGNAVDAVAYVGSVTTDIAGAHGDTPGDYTTNFGGTSSACPVAAGLGALMVAAAPEMTSDELTRILTDTAKHPSLAEPDDRGHDAVYGFGMLQAVPAMRSAVGLPPMESPADAGPTDGGGETTPPQGCSNSGTGGASLAWLAGALALVLRVRRRRD